MRRGDLERGLVVFRAVWGSFSIRLEGIQILQSDEGASLVVTLIQTE